MWSQSNAARGSLNAQAPGPLVTGKSVYGAKRSCICGMTAFLVKSFCSHMTAFSYEVQKQDVQ